MKKHLLLIVLLVITGMVYGQKIKHTTVKPVPYASEQKTLPSPQVTSLKAEGEVFFEETFDWKDPSNPSGWSLPAGWQIVDETDFGLKFIWRAGSDSIKGKYTFEPGHRYSLTPEDGYLVLPMDEYNFVDGIMTENGGTAWFQLPEFNCSNRPTVVLKFRQYYRCYPSTTVRVQVSNDLGVHWANYSLAYQTPTNTFCKNPFPEINISEVAGGMSSVWIRFVWLDMERYFWCIDDISLSEAYDNELQLEAPWLYLTDLEVDSDEGFYYMVPAAQTGTNNFGGYTFKAGFLNSGRFDQESCYLNAEVFWNGTSIYNENSPKVTDIWALQRDTFEITTPMVPQGYGNYEMVLTAKQDATDGVPSNNVYKDTYYITDSVYSISDWEFETYSSTASWGNNDGDYLGIVYDISKATEANSISTLIMRRKENPNASTKPGYGFQYFLFAWDAENQLWVEKIYSSYLEITEEMLGKWITLPLEKDGESEFLEPGQYIAAIQGFHGGGLGPDNNVYRFTIGSDVSHRYADGKSVFRLVTEEGWNINDTDLSMIRLNLNNTGAPASADVTFNVDMSLPIANGYFNPTSDFLDVAGSFNGWDGAAHHLADPDGDKIYSITVPALGIFEKIEYKYRINGNWNTSEFPSGGPNRVYRTTYYNMLHDVYNNGISMGVDLNALNVSISVFPNPANGLFTLSVKDSRINDLTLTVSNLSGQVVYHHQVAAVREYNSTIDLRHCPKGVYLLRVNDQVTKLLIE